MTSTQSTVLATSSGNATGYVTDVLTSGMTTNVSFSKHDQVKIPLYLEAYFPFGGGWDGSGILVAVQMALDHINNRDDILPNYVLRILWNDTQCQAGLGTRVFFDQLFKKPTKIMLIGGGCSTATQAIAGTSYHWNLVMMSYAASSPALSSRKLYPYFYRVVMPDTRYNPSIVLLMKAFGWKRVATIHENQEIFSLTIDNLLTLLKQANITLVTSESFAENPKNQMYNIMSQDAKIIIVQMYQTKVRRVFCEAYKLGMIGEGYVWILPGWYITGWYLEADDSIECSIEEMKQAVESSFYISIESLHIGTSTTPTISGITVAEFETELRERLKRPENREYKWNNRNPYGYDATWAVALMLNQSVATLKTKTFSTNKTRLLEDFTYDDNEMALMFLDHLKDVNFDGVSGSVSFVDGDRIDSVRIEQFRVSCEDGWHHYGTDCLSFVNDYSSFNQGKGKCNDQGGSLTAILHDEEQEFLVDVWRKLNLPEKSDYWFIGLVWNDGKLKWLDPSFGEVLWQPAQNFLPYSAEKSKVCVSIDFSNGNAKLIETNCSEILPYICRKPEAFLEENIGLYIPDGDNGYLDWYTNITWPGGNVPLDHTPEIVITVVRVHEGIDGYLYAVMCLLGGMGIALAVVFLLFNIYYRNQRFVRMSSPNLNNLILLGGILVYTSIFFAGLDSNLVSDNVVIIACQIRVWIFSLGFVLAFGSMFSKTWRVHKVAAFKKPKRRIITDNQLFVMVSVLFAVDVVILTTWQIVDPLEIIVKDLLERDDPDVANQRVVPYVKECTSEKKLFWLIPLYVYKGLLLIFGAFLAWEIRKVTIPALNDSKLIGISVYNVIILCAIGLSVSFIISDDPSVLYIFTSCIIIFCTSITLLIVFIPKIISVIKYPEGESISNIADRSNTMSGGTLDTMKINAALTEEVKQLKKKLQQAELEIRKRKTNWSANPPKASHPVTCQCSKNVVKHDSKHNNYSDMTQQVRTPNVLLPAITEGSELTYL